MPLLQFMAGLGVCLDQRAVAGRNFKFEISDLKFQSGRVY
jgi:hypothetical protein